MAATLKIVSHDEWLKARKALSDKEEEHARASEEVNALRRALPLEEVAEPYTFQSFDGQTLTLSDLFDGKNQLIVYHFMFSPTAKDACPGCSHVGDTFPNVDHLRVKNTNLVVVSRAPPERLAAVKERNGWKWPWYSSGATSTFNSDYHPTIDEAGNVDERFSSDGDKPGYTVFFKDEAGKVYHTYSSGEHGVENSLPVNQLLDLTLLGRQNDD